MRALGDTEDSGRVQEKFRMLGNSVIIHFPVGFSNELTHVLY